jgi:hypothetical protein
MAPRSRGRIAAGLSLAALAFQMSGCLAYEVRNDLRQVNTALEDVTLRLSTVNDSLLKLERTNTLLSDLDMRLTAMESTNATLMRIDQNLAAIRRALGSMKITMPDLEPEAAEPAAETPTDPASEPRSGAEPG